MLSDPSAAQPCSLPPNHHYHLRNGDFDPNLGKTIEEITLSTEHFIVYLDTNLSIQWSTTDSHKPTEHNGEILNRVSILEAHSSFIEDKKSLLPIRRQIAEGLARSLNCNNKDDSLIILEEAERQISARNKEISWKWYFTSAYWVTGTCALILILMWLLRTLVTAYLGVTAFEVVLGVLTGSLGALLSVTSRADRLTMDANAGKAIHQLEGLSRVGTGLIGAFLVALAVKSGLILGGVAFSGSKLSLLLGLCLASGASERIVPGLIDVFEKSATDIASPKESES